MGLPSNNHQQEGLVKSAVMSMMGGGGNSSLGSGAFHGSILKKLQQIAQRPGLDPQNPLPPTPGTNLPGSSTLLAKGLTTGLGTGLSTALGTEGGGGEAEAVAGGGAEGDPKSVNPSILTG